MPSGIEAKMAGHRGAAFLRVTIPGLVLAPLVAGAVFVCARAARLDIRMPLQLNYVEGFNADAAARIARGEPLYGDPSKAPFVVTVYTPGFPLLVAGTMALGVPPLAAGRLVSFLSTLAIAAVIGFAGRGRTGWIALAAAAAFLLDPLAPFWQVTARPDSTAALLTILGIVTLKSSGTGRRDIAAACLFAAALLTKQSFVAAPIAALSYLTGRGLRRAGRFAAALAMAVGLPALAVQAASHGWFLWHVIAGNLGPVSWGRAAALGGRFCMRHPLHLALLLSLVFAGWRSRPRSLPAQWAGVAFVVGAITLGKAGSDQNYLLETLAAIALLVARELPTRWLGQRILAARVCAGGLAAGVVTVALTATAEVVAVHQPVGAALQPYRELIARVARTPGLVVSDDACLLVEEGRPVHIQPFVMTQLAESGRWDQRPFLEELDRQRVRMIVAQVGPPSVFASRYTPEMRRLISLRYTVAARYRFAGEFAVLVPLESR